MSWYLALKCLHILSSTVLFGTGAGIAFFLVRARRSGDSRIIAAVSRDVVRADLIFTAPAVVVQPISGSVLAVMAGLPLSAPWVVWSAGLYVVVGCCWLRVVWLQIRLRDLASESASGAAPLPPQFERYYRRWFWLGWPAFLGVLVIFYLMVAKPGT
jgi:uncharacterized membrane protein